MLIEVGSRVKYRGCLQKFKNIKDEIGVVVYVDEKEGFSGYAKVYYEKLQQIKKIELLDLTLINKGELEGWKHGDILESNNWRIVRFEGYSLSYPKCFTGTELTTNTYDNTWSIEDFTLKK